MERSLTFTLVYQHWKEIYLLKHLLTTELDLPRSGLLSGAARHGAGRPLGPELEGAVLRAPVHVTPLLLFLGAAAEAAPPGNRHQHQTDNISLYTREMYSFL